MKRIAPAVLAYFDTIPAPRRAVLESLRRLVLKHIPLASETMLSEMPSYLLGGPVIAFKAQKNYFSLYFQSAADLIAEHAADLAGLDCGKSCVRFRRWEDLPQPVIGRMLEEAGRRAGFRDAPSGRAVGAC